ncbi:MAG TPA: 30S ribosome-binding factor RbfA [Solirubrobacteraceae bacterium]|jgi:ribosome-binding factor A
MTSGRMRRVDEAIRQVIGDALASEIKDPRVGFVTVTDVSTSADLRYAHVHVTVLGDEAQREDSMSGLRSAHGFLQRRIAAELHLKRTPTLDFHHDATTDRAMRIEQLLSDRNDQAGANAQALGEHRTGTAR